MAGTGACPSKHQCHWLTTAPAAAGPAASASTGLGHRGRLTSCRSNITSGDIFLNEWNAIQKGIYTCSAISQNKPARRLGIKDPRHATLSGCSLAHLGAFPQRSKNPCRQAALVPGPPMPFCCKAISTASVVRTAAFHQQHIIAEEAAHATVHHSCLEHSLQGRLPWCPPVPTPPTSPSFLKICQLGQHLRHRAEHLLQRLVHLLHLLQLRWGKLGRRPYARRGKACSQGKAALGLGIRQEAGGAGGGKWLAPSRAPHPGAQTHCHYCTPETCLGSAMRPRCSRPSVRQPAAMGPPRSG